MAGGAIIPSIHPPQARVVLLTLRQIEPKRASRGCRLADSGCRASPRRHQLPRSGQQQMSRSAQRRWPSVPALTTAAVRTHGHGHRLATRVRTRCQVCGGGGWAVTLHRADECSVSSRYLIPSLLSRSPINLDRTMYYASSTYTARESVPLRSIIAHCSRSRTRPTTQAIVSASTTSFPPRFL